jgi:hypothetical protein
LTVSDEQPVGDQGPAQAGDAVGADGKLVGEAAGRAAGG